MKKNERMRDKYPIFGAFGAKQTFLDGDATGLATRDDRIRSVWPFIVSRVLSFQDTLKPRERVNFDAEDVLAELWIAVAEKDHHWSPERGKFITFVGIIIDRALQKIRDRSRTVESPRDSTFRTREYEAEAEAGTLTAERRKTMLDILRTKGEIKSIAPNDRINDSLDGQHFLVDASAACPLDEAASTDSASASASAIRKAVRRLPTFEALVVSRLNGLGGLPRQSYWEIAWLTCRDENEVRNAAARANQKVRTHLLSLGHPTTKTA